jgi:hypothetical protein
MLVTIHRSILESVLCYLQFLSLITLMTSTVLTCDLARISEAIILHVSMLSVGCTQTNGGHRMDLILHFSVSLFASYFFSPDFDDWFIAFYPTDLKCLQLYIPLCSRLPGN